MKAIRSTMAAVGAAALIIAPTTTAVAGGEHGAGNGNGHCQGRGHDDEHRPGHGYGHRHHDHDCDDDGGDDYADPGNVSLSGLKAIVGEPFEVYVETDAADEATIEITSTDETVPDEAIEIAGTSSSTAPVEDGVAVFEVTVAEPGSYQVEATAGDTFVGSASFEAVVADDGDDDGDDHGGSDSWWQEFLDKLWTKISEWLGHRD